MGVWPVRVVGEPWIVPLRRSLGRARGLAVRRAAGLLTFLAAWLCASPRGHAEEGSLHVRFAEPVCAAATEKYVGILDGQSLVAETLLDAATCTWTVTLPPGRYGALCSAGGFAATAPRPVAVMAHEVADFSCQLAPLSQVRGTLVRSDTGTPLEGGTVQVLSVVLEDVPFPSALFAEHLARKHRGVADAHGRFSVPVRQGEETLLVASAPGMALAGVGPVQTTAPTGDVGSVELGEGGEVEVLLPTDLDPEDRWVFLGRLSESAEGDPQAAPLQDPAASWDVLTAILSRRVEGDGIVRFTSVPPGHYSAVLWSVSPRTLYRTRGSVPDGAAVRPSAASPRFVVTPGAMVSVAVERRRVELVVTVRGISRGELDGFRPSVLLVSSNIAAEGAWLPGGNDDPPRFRAVLEAAGVWLPQLVVQVGEQWLRRAGEPVVVTRDRRTLEVTMELTRRPMEGVVVAGRGQLPVAAAAVAVGGAAACDLSSFWWSTATDAEGRFSCPTCPAEAVPVWAYHPVAGSAYVPRGEGAVTLQLEPKRRVMLRCLDESGEPLEGVTAAFRPVPGAPLHVGSPSDRDGQLDIRGLPEVDGELVLQSFQAQARDLPVVKVSLPRTAAGYIGSFVFAAAGAVSFEPAAESRLLEGASWLALEGPGGLLGNVFERALGYGLSTGSTLGRSFEWERVPPGRYRLVATDPLCRVVRGSKPFLVNPRQRTQRHE